MPVPASESAEGLQTPEAYTQNEHYGHFDTAPTDKMAGSFDPDSLVNFGGSPMPRGSWGAPSDFKFDSDAPEVNLDAKKSCPTASPCNVDDLINIFDDDTLLPFSSQEMAQFNIFEDVDVDTKISMSIEEQNDNSTPTTMNRQWTTPAAPTAPAHCATDKYAQFAVATVNNQTNAALPGPDIVQNAMFQSALTGDVNVPLTADELANATFVMVQSGHGDQALSQFVTLDTASLQLGEVQGTAAGDAAYDIPLPVQNVTAEPSPGTSAAVLADDVVEAKVEESDAEEDAASLVAARAPNRRKRKAAPSMATSSVADDDDWTADQKLGYLEKRRRNNLAVRKSRKLAKEKQKTTEAEVERLRKENQDKDREIEGLQREVKVFRELFERAGFAFPRK